MMCGRAPRADGDVLCILSVCVEVSLCCVALHQTDLSWVTTAREGQDLEASHTHTHTHLKIIQKHNCAVHPLKNQK